MFTEGRLKAADLWTKIDEIISRIDPRQPDRSFAHFLAREKLRPDDRALLRGFVEGFDAARVERIGAHGLLAAQRCADRMEGDWQGRVREGYGALINYLAREARAAGARLVRNATVKSLRWSTGSVEVGWRQGGKNHTVEAAAAIVTVPLGV